MRRSFGVVLAGCVLAGPLPVLAEAPFVRTCGHNVMEDCAAMATPGGGPLQGVATEACVSFNATMTQFCAMLSGHEPESPEMLAATAKVIAARKHLLTQMRKPTGEHS